jgi:hypothetical protein
MKSDLMVRNEVVIKQNVVMGKLRKLQVKPYEAWRALQKLHCSEGKALAMVNKVCMDGQRREYSLGEIQAAQFNR